MESLIRALPPNVAFAGLSKYMAIPIDIAELMAVIEVVSNLENRAELRIELQDELRYSLRAYLKSAVEFALSQDDFNGHLKAYLATALTWVGEPEDIIELRADIQRVKNGCMARIRRELGPMAQGAGNCWAHWHIRALNWTCPNV